MSENKNMDVREYIIVKNEFNHPTLKEVNKQRWFGNPVCASDIFYILDELFFIRQLSVERTYVIALDVNKALKGICMVGQGDLKSSPCPMQSIFTFLMLTGAHSFYLAHNHPAYLPDEKTSKDDKDVTFKTSVLARMCDIEFVGHMIIDPYGFVIDGGVLNGTVFEEDVDECDY